MKTHELLATPEAELVGKLKEMKIKELEKHAQKIIQRTSNVEYNELMRGLLQAIPSLDSNNPENYQQIQTLIQKKLSESTAANDESEDVIARLTSILMLIISKKFLKIHNKS